MGNNKLEEILKQGMYGSPEIRPEERKLFLSTLAERVYLCLTNSQVRHRGMYPEMEKIMKEKNHAHLYINGALNYKAYSNYIQAANKLSLAFTIVNDGQDTPIGLVLADERAVNLESQMFIKDDLYEDDMDN
ncbi:YueI family protein [Salipaludibacillus daqingensis]|uniref:YueI family protein n=1 Tax=Salipaludibacillus daqingensis TaxID=3041001 RepID=UPI00247644A8|nr:YueI family protein [Salipaludibacillus daqingensis]